jgi:putative iron-regulated protein
LTKHRILRHVAAATAIAAVAVGMVGCGSSDSGSDGSAKDPATTTSAAGKGAALSEDQASAAATTYADLVFASYSDLLDAAKQLQADIGAFVADPTDATLATARESWLTARDAYGPTEVYRFYDGPIDDPDDGPEGQINAWPMDEAYVDAVQDDPEAGIINDTAGVPEITRDVIVEANEQGGETNISTGWHAIEFLLWGQDLSEDGPGDRPATDYTTAPNAERRAQYLTEVTDLLVDDLSSVAEQWDPEDGAYRKAFLKDPDQAVTDILGNAEGVRMIYLADYPGIDGTSLSEVVAAVEPELDADLRAQLDDTVAQAEALDAPFDQLILGDDDAPGRVALLALITSLQDQGDSVAELAGSLGYSIRLAI